MKLGRIERDYRMPLRKQLKNIAESYKGFQYLYIACRKIVFMYESEV